VKQSAKLRKQKKAAQDIAEILFNAQQKFPEDQQEEKARQFQRITSAVKRHKKSSKPSSIPGNSQRSRKVSEAR